MTSMGLQHDILGIILHYGQLLHRIHFVFSDTGTFKMVISAINLIFDFLKSFCQKMQNDKMSVGIHL